MSLLKSIFTSTAPWGWKRTCITLLLVFLMPIGFVGYIFLQAQIEQNHPTYYEKGSDFHLDDLPCTAHDVRFMPAGGLGPWGRAYEFQCSETDYRSWVAQKRRQHPELCQIREEARDHLPAITKDGRVEFKLVEDFLISDWRFEDQGYYLVYDRKDGRAITWSHSR